ncbi:MAG: ABC-F family ATP-binding cassette domain-containing protein [Acidisphaera sp.]|nr:ABC-F family ATP-binding cassette domain-containing protein [Acidisphaera sp.]
MAPPLLLLQDVSISLGSTRLLGGAGLAVAAGDRLCLVGRNGSGKSTLLKIAAGLLTQDDGSRFVQPGATIRYLPQEPDLSGYDSTLSYVLSGLGPGDDAHRARTLLSQLGLSGEEDPARLSGGEARRCALARVLAPVPDILLLDEPTNHLDLPAIEWLQDELAGLRSGLVLISHDRRLLEALSRAVIWLDRGTTRRLDRGFAHFEGWRDATLEQEEREHQKLGRRIAAEEDWLRYGVTARRRRNQRRLGELHAMRTRRREQLRTVGQVKLAAAQGELSGRLVIAAEGLEKSLGGRRLVHGFGTRVLRGDRVGIVGPNGAGKTTLLRLLTGGLPPDVGEVRLGTALQVVTLDQQRASLDPTRSLADTLTGGGDDRVIVNGESRHVVSYMKDFLFAPEQARTPVGVLSGGERGRLMLACALARPANLLVLDEPTNDLDLETLDLLQELLAEHPGTVLLVSHDRDFLDRVVTATIAAEGDGRWVEYAGGYSDMLAQRAPATEPARPPRASPRSAPPPRPTTPDRRLSFKQLHALRTLPARIAALQQEADRLRGMLGDPDLYRRDAARFASASEALQAAERELADSEETWLTLELLREDIEGT